MPNIALPPNPTVGQEYPFNGKTYVFNGRQWQIKYIPPIVASAAAPSNPVVGQEWFDTVNFKFKKWLDGGWYVFTATAPPGPQQTKFLYRFDDQANGATVFTDSSSRGIVPTRVVGSTGPVIATDFPKFGAGALNMNGGYLNFDTAQLPAPGVGDFCIEVFARPNSGPGDGGGLFQFFSGVTGPVGTYSGVVSVFQYQSLWHVGGIGTGNYLSTGVNTVTGQYDHICVQRKDGTVVVFVNGVPKITRGDPSTYPGGGAIGVYYAGTQYAFVGRMDEFRYRVDAPYDPTGFTPPAAPLPF